MLSNQWHDWYLSSLGVVRYVPRDQLPDDQYQAEGKGKSAEHAERELDAPQNSIDTPLPLAASAAPQRDTSQKAESAAAIGVPVSADVATEKLRSAIEHEKTSVQTTPTQRAMASVGAEQQLIQFRLGFWQPSEQVVVFSAMSPGIRPSRPQQEMLANLLSAIGQLHGPLSGVELLDWPLSPGADATLKSARELLAAFLDVKHQLKPFKHVLVMGTTAARLVSLEDKPSVGDRLLLACGAEGVVTHSLQEMEQDKSLKRPTWDAIRTLKGEAG